MYDELAKKIRHCATDPMHCLSCEEIKDGRCFKRLMTQAADAIEALEIRNAIYNANLDLANKLAETRKAIIDKMSKSKWIPVTERLPKVGEEVLIYLWDNERAYIAWIDEEGRWETDDFYIDKKYSPQVWMPLPEPPKGD